MFHFVSRFRKSIVALFIALTLAFSIQKAHASWSEFVAYAPAVTSAAAGSAGLVTAGTFLGLTPVGWAGIGLVVLATVLVASDVLSETGKTAVVVSTVPHSISPNPDINPGDVTAPVSARFLTINTVNSFSYLYTTSTSGSTTCNNTASGVSCPPLSADFSRLYPRLSEYFATAYSKQLVAFSLAAPGAAFCPAAGAPNGCLLAHFSDKIAAWPGYGSLVTAGTSYSTTTFDSAAANGGYKAASGYSGSAIQLSFPLASGSSLECNTSTSFYSFSLNACISKTASAASLNDGICKVSFNDNSVPVFNPFDPDCARAKDKMSLAVTPGSSSSAPRVSVTDPATGKQVITERPAAAGQGATPGSTVVRERIPDTTTNTTTEKVTITEPAGVSAANPAGAPVTAGSSQVVNAGTGSAAGSPLSSVVISNWPTNQSVTCTNCSAATVTFPERLKIDAEIPAGSEALPAAPAVESTTSFLDPVKNRLSSFLDFQLPAHTASCPALRIEFNAWGLNVNQSSNYLCELLEENRALFQGLMSFVYIASAIVIVLGA